MHPVRMLTMMHLYKLMALKEECDVWGETPQEVESLTSRFHHWLCVKGPGLVISEMHTYESTWSKINSQLIKNAEIMELASKAKGCLVCLPQDNTVIVNAKYLLLQYLYAIDSPDSTYAIIFQNNILRYPYFHKWCTQTINRRLHGRKCGRSNKEERNRCNEGGSQKRDSGNWKLQQTFSRYHPICAERWPF